MNVNKYKKYQLITKISKGIKFTKTIKKEEIIKKSVKFRLKF